MTIKAPSRPRCVSVRAFTNALLLQAPVIIEEDDDDFKPSASKGGEGAKKSSQEGLKRKRGRARIKYESDSEEEGPSKKTKPSPKLRSGAARTDTKGQKRVATTPKRQEVKSVSSFFGSAPVKRSSDFKNSKSTADGGDSKKDGGRKEKEGGEGKDTVICIPESPVDVTSHRFDEEAISEVCMSSKIRTIEQVKGEKKRENCRGNSLPLQFVIPTNW